MTGPNTFLTRLLVSPALIGCIFLLVGAILSRFPTRKINMYVGYRTRMSMLNQDTWDVANAFSGLLMRRLGMIGIITGVIVSLVTRNLPFIIFLNFGLTPTFIILLVVLTERKLRAEFDDKGNWKHESK